MEFSPEKPEMTTPATAGVACQGPSGEGDTSTFPKHHVQKYTANLSRVAVLLQRAWAQENRDPEFSFEVAGVHAVNISACPTYKPQVEKDQQTASRLQVSKTAETHCSGRCPNSKRPVSQGASRLSEIGPDTAVGC